MQALLLPAALGCTFELFDGDPAGRQQVDWHQAPAACEPTGRPPVPAERPVSVVTGANRGIGRDVARQLAEHGHTVALGCRDLHKGQRAAGELDASGEYVRARQLDVADPASVTAMAGWVERELGRADLLVNNAATLYDVGARG